jgi:DNA-binding PadR family transcriptional regulator
MRWLTNLEYMLLFLLQQEPASGYALRKQFASTPLGHYSDSPGSIYPALKRLERRGLIRPVKQQPTSGRGTQLFRTTPKALVELRAWAQGAITREEMRADVQALMLRFVVGAQLFGGHAAHKFILQFESRVHEVIQELDTYLREARKDLPLAGRLAVEQGLEGYLTLARWAARAGKELSRSQS